MAKVPVTVKGVKSRVSARSARFSKSLAQIQPDPNSAQTQTQHILVIKLCSAFKLAEVRGSCQEDCDKLRQNLAARVIIKIEIYGSVGLRANPIGRPMKCI